MKPTQHGGKRPNAGRKPGNPRQSLTIRLSEPAIAKLNKIRDTTGTSAGKLVEGMILDCKPDPTRFPVGSKVKHATHGKGVVFTYDQCDETSCGVDFEKRGQWCIALAELTAK